MSRSNFGGPKLPRTLLDQVQGGRVSKRKEVSRKDKRKQERQEKKQHPVAYEKPRIRDGDGSEEKQPPPRKSTEPHKDAKLPKSILKRTALKEDPPSSDEDREIRAPVVSRAVKAKLEDDDAEIAALEKKLGLKKKKSKKVGDAELDWLVYGSDSEDGDGNSKRKRPEDDAWLKNKRQKAKADESMDEEEEDMTEDDDMEEDGNDLENPFSEDESSDGDFDDQGDEEHFEGFDDHDDSGSEPTPVRQKENPYVAPVQSQSGTYVPPLVRKAPSNEEESLKQLRRQIQGQLNRLSEANMLSILQTMQDLYTNNARQHVTSLLIELLVNLVCDPSVLNDTFLILHAGFASAVYRSVGIDFGAQLVEMIVQSFDAHYKTAEGKQSLNLLAFLSNLYAFQVVGCEIMFDYIRMLLDKENFSETSTELLLRVIRMSGTQLRQDDPSALKDIVLLLQRTVSSIGQDNVSVRTKFMIETIHDLKNNRMKTGLSASALTAEHMQRMKKTLGSVKGPKATEPLRIGLTDIRESEKKGKWWLVGASWKDPAKMANGSETAAPANNATDKDAGDESNASDSDVDLDKLARAQGMNTDVRRAIFVAATGAVDYNHAHMRIMKLNLKNKQLLEVPRVLVHCIGAEPVYNHFYTLVATKFCGEHKLRKAYQFSLLDVFRRMGETRDGQDSDDEEADVEEMSARKIYNIAKMYATLVCEGLLRITILKTLHFANLTHKTRIFVEAFLTSTFLAIRKKAHKAGYQKATKDCLGQAHAVPDMVPGLKYYLENVIPESEIAANKKERNIIGMGCEWAVEALEERRNDMPVEDGLSD